MLVVGLTGGIATGKSSVSEELKANHVPVIDLDILARRAVAKGSKGLEGIVKAFGKDILLPEGDLDRPALGRIVFADETKRKKLNSIVHPQIQRLMLWDMVCYWLRGEKMIVLDSPLLVEGSFWKYCGWIIVVWCDQEQQLRRLMSRNPDLSEKEAKERIAAQKPVSDKIQYADTVIDNSSTPENRSKQVEMLLLTLYGRANWTWRISWLVPPIGLLLGAFRIAYRLWYLRIGSNKRKSKWSVQDDKLVKQD